MDVWTSFLCVGLIYRLDRTLQGPDHKCLLVLILQVNNEMTLSPCVQIWVYGNSFESTLLAVCVPNQPALEVWAESNGVEGDFAQICKDPKAQAHIMAALNATGKSKKVFPISSK